MSTPRFSFRVVIEQDKPQEQRNFGSKEQWASIIKESLGQVFSVANVVEVTPIRNRTKTDKGK